MPYQPGPLVLQSEGNVGIGTSNYDFTGFAHDQLGDVDTIPAGWDGFIETAGVLLDGPADPFPGIDINGAMDTVAVYSDPAAAIGISTLADALAVADTGLALAIGRAPAEAWIDRSTQFIPPVPAEVISVPYIPPDSISFDVQGVAAAPPVLTVTGQPLTGAGGSGVPPVGGGTIGSGPALPGNGASIGNSTAVGSDTFTVGDTWSFSATGLPGTTVYAYWSQDGVDRGGGPVGTIRADRTFSSSGQWTFGDEGVWSLDVWVGQSEQSPITFIVLGE